LSVIAAPELALAAADDDELSQARARFQQGTELEQAGNWAAALQAFREVGQVRMTPQVRYHIALCEEKLGRLVAAFGGYELALSDADAVGPGFREEVERSIERLRARIPRLTIERGPGAEAATIELGGVSLGASSIGVPVPIDPGPHALSATAPGHEPFETTVEIAEGEEETVVVELERVQTPDPGPVTPRTSPEDAGPDPSNLRLTAYISGGVGGASLIGSGVFFLLMRQKLASMEDLCGDDDTCRNDTLTAEERDNAEDWNAKIGRYYYLTWGALGVGVVGLGAGTYFYIRAMQADEERAKAQPDAQATVEGWQLAPSAPGADLAGLSVVGRF
jgi:hypothetical protein